MHGVHGVNGVKLVHGVHEVRTSCSPFFLKVIILRLVGIEQPGEGELESGGVALDQLRRDVEVRIVAALTRAQRTVRHVEKVKAREPERVRGHGHIAIARQRNGDFGRNHTLVTVPLAINMDK